MSRAGAVPENFILPEKHATIAAVLLGLGPMRGAGLNRIFATFPGGGAMQSSLIIESNGSNKDKLDQMLKDGWTVVSITANHGKSYNDFLVIVEK
jgi:hypothetical protein